MRGGFSTFGTIVTIHRRGMLDRSSWTDRTMPKIFDPFKLSSTIRPLYWAQRQRRASTELVVSTVCTMTSSGQAAHGISQKLTKHFSFFIRPASTAFLCRTIFVADATLCARGDLFGWPVNPADLVPPRVPSPLWGNVALTRATTPRCLPSWRCTRTGWLALLIAIARASSICRKP